MGQVTPNMGIYIPAAGETNYDASFAAGMVNIDQHDHSGGPNKGVQIAGSGLADGSVTYTKLAPDVADNTTGIGTSGELGANQLNILGILQSIYKIVTATGFISKSGAVASALTMSGTKNQIDVSSGDGSAGNPIFSLSPGFYSSGTFLPTASPSGSSYTGLSYSEQNGSYQIIGNWVFININLSFTASSGTGTFAIGGLPSAIQTSISNLMTGFSISDALTPNQQAVNMKTVAGGFLAVYQNNAAPNTGYPANITNGEFRIAGCYQIS